MTSRAPASGARSQRGHVLAISLLGSQYSGRVLAVVAAVVVVLVILAAWYLTRRR
jgi:hypothetical protein